MAKKSLFRKFTNLFNKNSKEKISVNQAIDIQNKYISMSFNKDVQFKPPYLEIVKQLYSTKPEVFSAALYYLQKIACNEPNETKGIIEELNICLSTKEIIQQNKEQIAEAITYIHKVCRD